MVVFIHTVTSGGNKMGIAVKKTISLPPELAKEVEEIAREERKP